MQTLNLKEFEYDDEVVEISGTPFVITANIPARALSEIESLSTETNVATIIRVIRHFLCRNDPKTVDILLDNISVAGMNKLMMFLSEWFAAKMKTNDDKKKD